MKLKSGLFGAACVAALSLTFSLNAQAEATAAKHVLLLSVDGLHETDLSNFIRANPDSTLAKLAAHGIPRRFPIEVGVAGGPQSFLVAGSPQTKIQSRLQSGNPMDEHHQMQTRRKRPRIERR